MDAITQMQQKLTDNPVTQFWMKAAKTQLAHAATFATELEKLQLKGFAQATQGIDEAARLAKEGLAATQELSAAWQKMAGEAVAEVTRDTEA